MRDLTKDLAQDDGPREYLGLSPCSKPEQGPRPDGGNRNKRGQMAHAYPPKPHSGGRRVALALMIVVILGFVGGIILRSTPTGTSHPQVTHSAVHHPVKEPKATPAPPAQATAPHTAHIPHHTTRTYKVRTGDSLWSIAAHVYHNPLDWHKLYELNHSLIGGNPNLIHTGVIFQLE